MDFIRRYLEQTAIIAAQIEAEAVKKMVYIVSRIRSRHGRLFFLGVGGGAGHASHAVNDFRKLAGIECYTPTDNVSELTARINDEGWDSSFTAWLRTSKVGPKDGLFIFSVGGGSVEMQVSVNLVNAIDLAKEVGAAVLGIVGRDGGYTAKCGDAVIVVPTVDPHLVTPHTEAFQAVLWHLLVSHPDVSMHQAKWNRLQSNEAP